MEKENEIYAYVKLAVNGKTYCADLSKRFSVNYLKGEPYISDNQTKYCYKLNLMENGKEN